MRFSTELWSHINSETLKSQQHPTKGAAQFVVHSLWLQQREDKVEPITIVNVVLNAESTTRYNKVRTWGENQYPNLKIHSQCHTHSLGEFSWWRVAEGFYRIDIYQSLKTKQYRLPFAWHLTLRWQAVRCRSLVRSCSTSTVKAAAAGRVEEEELVILAIAQVIIWMKARPRISFKYHFWEVLPYQLHIVEPWFLRGETQSAY